MRKKCAMFFLCLQYLEAIIRVSKGWMVTVWLSSSVACRCPRRMAATELADHVQPLQEQVRDPSEQMVCVMCKKLSPGLFCAGFGDILSHVSLILSKVSKVSEDLWKRSFDPMDGVSSGIQGACSSASMPSLLVMVSEMVRYVWHRSEEHGKTAELGQRFGHFGKQLRSKIEHSEARILDHNSTIPVNVESLRRDLEEARGCVKAIVPWFLVLAEDADLCGQPCSVPFQQIQHAVKEGLGADPTSHPYLRKLSRVGLAAKQACDCSAIRAISVDHQTDHYAKSQFSRDFQERRERVAERSNKSVQYLLSECSLPSACNSAQSIQFAFSDKVHDLFRGQLGKLRSALKQGLYDDVLAIISSIPAWEALRYSVQPELIIAKDHQSMKEWFIVGSNQLGTHFMLLLVRFSSVSNLVSSVGSE